MAPSGEDRPAPTVVVQRSIRGVQLGMDPARVRELLDRAPDSSRTDPHPILERTKTWTFGALRVVFDGVKAGARVISVSTTSKRDRTNRGRRRRLERDDREERVERFPVPHRVRLPPLLGRKAGRGRGRHRLLDLEQGARLARLALARTGLTRRTSGGAPARVFLLSPPAS